MAGSQMRRDIAQTAETMEGTLVVLERRAAELVEVMAELRRANIVPRAKYQMLEVGRHANNYRKALGELRREARGLELSGRKLQHALKEAIGQIPKYQTAEFRCVSDRDKCIRHTKNAALCKLVFLICLGRRLMPFIKG